MQLCKQHSFFPVLFVLYGPSILFFSIRKMGRKLDSQKKKKKRTDHSHTELMTRDRLDLIAVTEMARDLEG